MEKIALSKPRKKSAQPIIQVRVPQADYLRLQKLCQNHGVTMSDLVRSLIFSQPLKTASSRRALGETAELVRELRRQGGLLKMLIRSERDGLIKRELGQTLFAIQRTSARIWETLEEE